MQLSNPFEKKTCPHCFEEFALGECEIYSSVEIDSIGEDLLLRPRLQGFSRWIEQALPDKLSHNLFQKHQPYRRCPNSACKKALPYNITTNESCVIGVIGGRGSGKSHYIAALIETLLYRTPIDNLGIVEMAPLPKIQAQFTREYYNPLFGQRGKLQANIPGKLTDPLVYTFTFAPQAEGQPPRSLNLVMIDVSGEDLTDETQMVRIARFLLHARGFIMVVDPLVSESFVDLLPPHLKPSDPPGERALVVLNNLILNIRRYRGLSDGTKIPLPIAIVTGKGDLARNVLSPTDLRTEPLRGSDQRLPDADYRNGFSLEQYQRVSDASEVFLRDFDNGPLVQRARGVFHKDQVSFSTVTATGQHFDDQLGQFRGAITPRRCADPLLWIFHSLGFLKL